MDVRSREVTPLLVEADALSFSFADSSIFEQVDFILQPGERVALIGANGAGKSTLLKILAGDLTPTGGQIRWIRGRPTLAYLPQEEDDDANRPESGGERMRRRLKAAFSSRPALLLLDEPTNHLDDRHLQWLLTELRGFDGAVLMACHDRAFVDALCTRVFHLDRGSLQVYSGNYSAFEAALSAQRRGAVHRHESWEKEKEHIKEAADQQRRWAVQAHQKAGVRDPTAKRLAAKAMKKALATEERLARHETDRPDRPFETPRFQFQLGGGRGIPDRVLRAEAVTFTYALGKAPVFRSLTLDVRKGERLALLGPNGSGKSTLLGLAAWAGGLAPMPDGHLEGRISIPGSVRTDVFRQEGTVDPDRTPLEQMLTSGARDPSQARTLLGVFALEGESALRPAKDLSPGERVRLAFALTLVAQPDLLILDEPTNHLDLDGRRALEEALSAYPGAVLLATHDLMFRERVATRTLSLGGEETAPSPAQDPPDELILGMRLDNLSGKLPAAKGEERRKILEEISRLTATLRELRSGK